MSDAEATLELQNLKRSYERRRADALQAADTYRAHAANPDNGHLTRGSANAFAIEQDQRAGWYARRIEALDIALSRLPALEFQGETTHEAA